MLAEGGDLSLDPPTDRFVRGHQGVILAGLLLYFGIERKVREIQFEQSRLESEEFWEAKRAKAPFEPLGPDKKQED